MATRSTVAPSSWWPRACAPSVAPSRRLRSPCERSEEHTSELQSLRHLVCRLLLEKKKTPTSNAAAQTDQDNKPTAPKAHARARDTRATKTTHHRQHVTQARPETQTHTATAASTPH